VKPAPFDYHAPTTVDEAVALLAEHGDEAKPLAGGQSLVPLLALRLTRFAHLIDLNEVTALSTMSRKATSSRSGRWSAKTKSSTTRGARRCRY
jgi:carbon-monoxide dehydrogenase medium subunit